MAFALGAAADRDPQGQREALDPAWAERPWLRRWSPSVLHPKDGVVVAAAGGFLAFCLYLASRWQVTFVVDDCGRAALACASSGGRIVHPAVTDDDCGEAVLTYRQGTEFRVADRPGGR